MFSSRGVLQVGVVGAQTIRLLMGLLTVVWSTLGPVEVGVTTQGTTKVHGCSRCIQCVVVRMCRAPGGALCFTKMQISASNSSVHGRVLYPSESLSFEQLDLDGQGRQHHRLDRRQHHRLDRRPGPARSPPHAKQICQPPPRPSRLPGSPQLPFVAQPFSSPALPCQEALEYQPTLSPGDSTAPTGQSEPYT